MTAPPAPSPLLDVRNLRKWYEIGGSFLSRPQTIVKAVDDISFSIGAGEVLGLAGESGSGKSTIGRAILRLVEPSSGEVRFDGIDVVTLGTRPLRDFRREAQIVFQDPLASLDPRMTVERIVAEPLRVQGLARGRGERRQRVVELLEMVALGADHLERRPHELSGGQRQRIGIARALAVSPRFLVADEPVSALDVSIQAQIVNLLEDIRERLGLTMLFISHDIAVMEHVSDRIAVVYLGKLMEIAPTDDLVRRPKHPYTEALLSAVPDPDPSLQRRRIVLEGDLPSAAAPPSGCVFRTRCPYALADCARVAPPLREIRPQHFAACIRDDIL